MGISEQYTKEIAHELKYSGTWFPNVSIAPGDVGIFQDYQFYPQGNLNDYGIPFNAFAGSSHTEFEYSSKDSVSVEVKLAGQAPLVGSSIAEAEAGATIRFNRENSILFRALFFLEEDSNCS